MKSGVNKITITIEDRNKNGYICEASCTLGNLPVIENDHGLLIEVPNELQVKTIYKKILLVLA